MYWALLAVIAFIFFFAKLNIRIIESVVFNVERMWASQHLPHLVPLSVG